MMTGMLEHDFYGNTIQDLLIAAGIILLGFLLIRILKGTLLRAIGAWAQRSTTHFDDMVLRSIDRFGIPALYFLVIYIGLRTLAFPARGEAVLRIAVTVVITYFIIRLISSIIHLVLRSYVGRQEKGEEKVKQLGGIMLIINIVIWITGLLFLFDNMGYDITAVIAGLGIGGIAVALAAQNILGDLFNYFVIFFDRPFEIGDFIVVDQKSGTVEHIGIKTTRVRSITGEQLVFSNSDLTEARLHNYKRMQTRRIAFKFGVTYQTPFEKLQQIPSIVRTIIDGRDQVVFDRAHLVALGGSSLDFEVVYIVQTAAYNTYADIHQGINLELIRKFQELGIEFAYPTQTIFMMKADQEEESRPEPPR